MSIIGPSFELFVDGRKVSGEQGRHNYPNGNLLSAYVLPERKGIDLALFATPITDYVGAFKHPDYREGAVVDMGSIPTLVASRRTRVEETLKPDHLYDIAIMWTADRDVEAKTPSQKSTHKGYRYLATGDRIYTGEGKVPTEVTLDELKFLIAEMLDFTPEELRGIEATIYPTFAFSNRFPAPHNGFSFSFGEGRKYSYTVHVSDNNEVALGLPKEQFRRYIADKRKRK